MSTTIIILIAIAAIVGCTVLACKKPGWAMGLLVVTTGTSLIAGAILIETRQDLPDGPILIYTGILIFLMTVLVVFFKRQSDIDQEPWHKSTSRILLFILKNAFYLVLLTLIFQAMGPVLFIVMLIFRFRFSQTKRYSLALNVLSTLSAAMRQNLPLPMALETAASNPQDPAAGIYRKTSKYLCEGRTLSDALRLAYRKCPAEILASLTAAEAMNQLPAAIAALEQDSVAILDGDKKIRPLHPSYPLLVGAVAFFIIFGLCVFIVPTLAEVIRDITGGAEGLPRPTQMLLDMSVIVKRNEVLVPILMLLLVGLPIGFYIYNRPRWPERPLLMSRLGDWLKWHAPGIHYFERLDSQKRLIQGLSVGLKGGYSFNAVIEQLLSMDINLCYRKKLRRWLGCIEAGQPVADSAAACGLGSTLAWALDEKVNKGNTPQLLAMLEEVYRNRYHYRLNIFHSIFWPFVVIGLGSGVGFVMYAMFAATTSLITYTLDYTMP